MDIYLVLSSVEHNIHYLNRYITFIYRCQFLNGAPINRKDYHLHHICPKALFPMYKNLKRYSWNGVYLTPRQHFIAHLILAKALPHNCIIYAFICMSNKKCYGSTRIINSRLYQGLLSKCTSYERTEEILNKLSNSTKNLVAAYDTINCINVRVTKEEFEKNEYLVGIVKFKNVNSYRKLKDDYNENMSKAQILSKQNKLECPHCKKLSDKSNYMRWHGNNCTKIPENKSTTIYHAQKKEQLFVKLKDLQKYLDEGYIIRSPKNKNV